MRGFLITILFAFFLSLPILGQNIIVRNKCLTQCANCSSAATQSPTVFEWTKSVPIGTTFVWDFGDPSSPGNTSTGNPATHQYCAKGNYSVKVTIKEPSGTSTTQVLPGGVNIGQLPSIYLGNDPEDVKRSTCSATSLTLNPFAKIPKSSFPTGVTVNWFPNGETTDQIQAKDSGCYSVEVTDPQTGCSVEAKMQVSICDKASLDKTAATSSKSGSPSITDSWHFGKGCGLAFYPNPSNPSVIPSNLDVFNGVAKMADPYDTSSLLFYTDGKDIYKTPTQKLNLVPLISNSSTAQGVTIIPKTSCKGCQSEYYIFTLGDDGFGNNVVYTSILDMKLNGGKGGIKQSSTLLSNFPSTSRIVASKGGDDFYWLITQDANSSITRTYKVSSAGISAPMITSGGTTLPRSIPNSNSKVSIDGTLMAVSIPGPPTNKIDLYTLDLATGNSTFSKTLNLGPSPPSIYGLEFSPNKDILYVSTQGDGSTVKSEIWQFDLTKATTALIESSKQIIYTATSFSTIYGALQIDPVVNTTIFVADLNSPYLGKIQNISVLKNPSIVSILQPIFTPQGVEMPGCSSLLGLPPSIPAPDASDGPPKILLEACEGMTYKFKLEDKKLCDPIPNGTINWKVYESTLSPIRNTDGIFVPKDLSKIINKFSATGPVLNVAFDHSGTYVITAEISNGCVTNYLLEGQEFKIEVLEPVNLAKEFNRICSSAANIQLDQAPLSPNLQYEWKWNGAIQTSPIAKILKPGGDVSLTLSIPIPGGKSKCSISMSTKVNFIDPSNIISNLNPFICMEPPVVPLTITLNTSTTDLGFNWSGPSIIGSNTSNQIKLNKEGVYQVDVSDLRTNWNRCPPLTVPIKVDDKCERAIIAPNIFTPRITTEPSINDYFIPQELPKSSIRSRIGIVQLQIFNRWGELIFSEKNNPSNPLQLKWDGYLNGKPVPQESYVWVVEYEEIDFPEKGIQTQRGAVIVAY